MCINRNLQKIIKYDLFLNKNDVSSFSYYVLVNIMCCGNTDIYINANKNHKHKKRVMLSNIRLKQENFTNYF